MPHLDETAALVPTSQNSDRAKQIFFEMTCVMLALASVTPYWVITSNAPKYYTASVTATNFFINRVAAETALKFWGEKLQKKEYIQFVASFISSALTALPLTVIAYDHAKADSALITGASFLGNAAINALALTTIINTAKNALSRKTTNSATLEKILGYPLKFILAVAMTFCALILTSATEMEFRKSFHQSDGFAFGEALALMTPIILLCAIGGWDRGDAITQKISTYYHEGTLNLAQSKKTIALTGLLASTIGCLSGKAIETLQETTCDASMLRSLTTFLGANIAAFVSATLFNINFCYLSLDSLRQLLVKIFCKPAQNASSSLSESRYTAVDVSSQEGAPYRAHTLNSSA